MSGPQRPGGRPGAAAGGVALPAPGAPLARVLAGVRAIPDSRFLDRLIRGQGWIVIIGIALMGIVALQVSLLKMNAGIGTSIEQAGSLERHNADLRAEVSRLSSEERIASVALKQGLVMPSAGEVRYVGVRGAADARKAAAVMRPPDLADDAALVAAPAAAVAAPVAAEPVAAPAPVETAPEAQAAPAAEPEVPAVAVGATPAPGTTAVAGQ